MDYIKISKVLTFALIVLIQFETELKLNNLLPNRKVMVKHSGTLCVPFY